MAKKFKHFDVVVCTRESYVGIITTERTNENGHPCLMATWWPPRGDHPRRWDHHPDGHTSGDLKLHPHPDQVIALYTAALLRGEVNDVSG